MKKSVKAAKTKSKKANREWPLVVYVWMGGLGIMGYLIFGEIMLGSKPHPVHWLSGLVGALIGYSAGWIWFRWRGDII